MARERCRSPGSSAPASTSPSGGKRSRSSACWPNRHQLVSSLDNETILHTIADLVISTMADYCIIEIQDEAEHRSIEVMHAEPEQAARARALLVAAGNADGSGDLGPIVWTDRPLLVPRVTLTAEADRVAELGHGGIQPLLALALGEPPGTCSLLCVPLWRAAGPSAC